MVESRKERVLRLLKLEPQTKEIKLQIQKIQQSSNKQIISCQIDIIRLSLACHKTNKQKQIKSKVK